MDGVLFSPAETFASYAETLGLRGAFYKVKDRRCPAMTIYVESHLNLTSTGSLFVMIRPENYTHGYSRKYFDLLSRREQEKVVKAADAALEAHLRA